MGEVQRNRALKFNFKLGNQSIVNQMVFRTNEILSHSNGSVEHFAVAVDIVVVVVFLSKINPKQ